MTQNLLGNTVTIITGATGGIGQSIVNTFLDQGASVVGLYRTNTQAAHQMLSDANKRDRADKLQMVPGTIEDKQFITKTFAETNERFGRIDVLVNNAGLSQDAFLTQMTQEQWNTPIRVNFGGTLNCIKAALPYMEQRKSGSVINVVSMTAVFGREAQCNYGASKGAIIGLTKLLARRYTRQGIRFNAVAPGMIKTEMLDHVPERKLENVMAHTHYGRLGYPDEVAGSVLFLALSMSSYISGTVLKVDGGFVR